MEQIFRQEFRKGLLWNYLNKLAGYGINFVLIIIIARSLGNYEFGVFSELLTLAALLMVLCSLGFESILNIYIPKYFDNPGKISYLLRVSFAIVFLFSLLIYLMLLTFGKDVLEAVNNVQLAKYLNIIFLYVFFQNLAVIAEFVFQSYYRTQLIAIMNFSMKLILLTAISLILFKYDLGIIEILYAYAITYIVIVIISFAKLKSYFLHRPEKFKLTKIFKTGFSVWLTKFLDLFLGRYLDIFLLGFFLIPKEQIGYYNVAFTLTMALLYLVTAGFSGIGLSAFSELASKNNLIAIGNGWLKIMKGILFFLVPLFLFVIFNAEMVVNNLFGSEFEKSAELFQIFAPFFLLSLLLGSGLNSTVLYSIHKEKTVLYLRILIGVINLVLDIILIPKYGALGAVVATGIATISIIGLEFWVVNKSIKLEYPLYFVVKLGVASIVGILVSRFFVADDLLGLVTSMLVFTAVYVATISLLKVPVYGYIRTYVLNYS